MFCLGLRPESLAARDLSQFNFYGPNLVSVAIFIFNIHISFRVSLVKVFLISSVRYCRCFWTPRRHRYGGRHFYLKRVRVRGPNLFRNAILVTDRECCTFYLLPHYNDAAALDSCALRIVSSWSKSRGSRTTDAQSEPPRKLPQGRRREFSFC